MERYFNGNVENGVNCWRKSNAEFSLSTIFIVILLVSINVIVMIGNFLVILTILTNKRLRKSNSNLLIISLASSDFFLSIFVLPFWTVHHSLGSWTFGETFCRIWLTTDVWLCTASIYNLVIITIDRFIAVTKPLSYKSMITTKKILAMISTAWSTSLVVGIPLIFREREGEIVNCECNQMNNEPSYILLSSVVSFYAPFFVITYFYCRIYKRIRSVSSSFTNGFIDIGDKKRFSSESTTAAVPTTTKSSKSDERNFLINKNSIPSGNLRVHRGGYTASNENVLISRSSFSLATDNGSRPRSRTWEVASKKNSNELFDSERGINGIPNRNSRFGRRYENSISRYQKRLVFELNALKTVGVVTGCFLFCWFGFCLIYGLHALKKYPLSDQLVSATVWLGYANSGINPFIYAACNRQYRRGFQRLFSRKRRQSGTASTSFSTFSQSRRHSFLFEASFVSEKDDL